MFLDDDDDDDDWWFYDSGSNWMTKKPLFSLIDNVISLTLSPCLSIPRRKKYFFFRWNWQIVQNERNAKTKQKTLMQSKQNPNPNSNQQHLIHKNWKRITNAIQFFSLFFFFSRWNWNHKTHTININRYMDKLMDVDFGSTLQQILFQTISNENTIYFSRHTQLLLIWMRRDIAILENISFSFLFFFSLCSVLFGWFGF